MSRPAVFTAASDLPANETERLAALRALQILDSEREADFDLLTRVAAELCDAQHAFVTLVDAERTWIKASTDDERGEVARSQSYCSIALLGDAPSLVIADVAADPRTAHIKPPGLPGHGLYAGAVLQTRDGYRLGTLCVFDERARELPAERLALLHGLADQVVQLIELRAARRELERIASTDALTGLGNRRALMQRLRDEAERCHRYGAGFSLLLLDLDHFKQVNDRHGHETGDLVLANTAALLRSMLRSADFAARHGGEEFCVVLPHTPIGGALTWAEHFRLRLAEYEHRLGDGMLKVSASIGIAEAEPHSQPSLSGLMQQADAALYRAKHAGRNRTELAG